MTEAYVPLDEIPTNDVMTVPGLGTKNQLELLPQISEDIRRAFVLLADGNSRVVDYTGCEERGGEPLRYIDPRYIAKPALKSVG